MTACELDLPTGARVRSALAAAAAVSWALLALAGDRAAVLPSYLVGFVFWITVAAGALFFVMLQHVTGAAWSVTSRRVAENIAATVPLGAALFVPLAFGLPHLYGWARPEAVARDAILQGKQAFLNPQAFVVRAAVYFAVWSLWALVLYSNSVKQDAGGTLERTRAAARWSAPGLVLLSVTFCLAAFDWVMSLDPHWYSTIFGVHVYAGAGLAGFAAITVVLLALRRAGALRREVNEEHYHDHGKWLFALTVFWAYIAFCEYMLIWYANLPEETVWYRDRLVGSWRWVAAAVVLGQFFVPFFLLLGRNFKRRLGVLAFAAVWILAMHYVELYWMIMPVFRRRGAMMQWTDAAAFVAVGASFGLAFWWLLRRNALVPAGDLRLEKCLEFTNV